MLLNILVGIFFGPGVLLLVLSAGGNQGTLRKHEQTMSFLFTMLFYCWILGIICWVFRLAPSWRGAWVAISLGMPPLYILTSFLYRYLQLLEVRKIQKNMAVGKRAAPEQSALGNASQTQAASVPPIAPGFGKVPQEPVLLSAGSYNLGVHHVSGSGIHISCSAFYRADTHTVVYDEQATGHKPIHEEYPIPASVTTRQELETYLWQHHSKVTMVMHSF